MPFLSAVASFIIKRPWIVAIAALLILSGYLGIKLKVVSASLEEKMRECARLSEDIEEQNAAIETFEAAARDQAQRALDAEKKAARVRAEQSARVARIMAEAIPAQCDNAIRWAAQKGIELGRAWEGSP